MKRRLVSAIFSVMLVLSVCGNSVYASGMGNAEVPSVMAGTEESLDTEGTESDESVEASSEEAVSEDAADSEVSTEDSAETSGENDPEESVEDGQPEESTEESSQPEESTEESSQPEESTEESSQPEESTEESSQPEESTEESSEPEESAEESSAPEESAEEKETTPKEDGEDVSEVEEVESGESEEYISDEEISEVYYASTSDGWSFAVDGNYATITGYSGKNTVLKIPDTVRDSATGKYYSVTAIGTGAFSAEWSNSPNIHNTITEVTVPDSVTRIGNKAFAYATNLKKIHLGSGVTTIGYEAFASSGITGIIFPKSVSSLGYKVLYNCDSLGTIQLDCQVTAVPAGFAAECDNLLNVMLGDKVTGYYQRYESGTLNYRPTYTYMDPFANTPMLKAIYGANTKCGVGSSVSRYDSSNPLPAISKPVLKVMEDAESRGILMTTTTPGAIIFYSTTGSSMNLENEWVASGNGVDFTFFKGTVYARTYLCGQWSAPVSITLEERKPAQPSFAVKGVFGGREVTFNTTQKDGVIYYSTKNSTEISTSSSRAENGQAVLFENFYGSVYAKTYYNGHWSDASRLILKIPVVNDPVITYAGDKVTIRTSTPDAYIYYTTDGSTPSINNGKRLSKSGGTFTLPSGTVKAIAVRSCFTNSNVVSRKITPVVDANVKVPSFQVKGVIGGRTVTFNTTQKDAVIYYSSTSSTLTTADKRVYSGQSVTFEDFYGTIYARTYSNGKWSNVARLILKIPVVNKPTIRSNGGGYYTISTSTPNCTIYYTTDGSTPSPTNGRMINGSSGRVYIGSGYYRIKAIAVRSCFTNSPVYTY